VPDTSRRDPGLHGAALRICGARLREVFGVDRGQGGRTPTAFVLVGPVLTTLVGGTVALQNIVDLAHALGVDSTVFAEGLEEPKAGHRRRGRALDVAVPIPASELNSLYICWHRGILWQIGG